MRCCACLWGQDKRGPPAEPLPPPSALPPLPSGVEPGGLGCLSAAGSFLAVPPLCACCYRLPGRACLLRYVIREHKVSSLSVIVGEPPRFSAQHSTAQARHSAGAALPYFGTFLTPNSSALRTAVDSAGAIPTADELRTLLTEAALAALAANGGGDGGVTAVARAAIDAAAASVDTQLARRLAAAPESPLQLLRMYLG